MARAFLDGIWAEVLYNLRRPCKLGVKSALAWGFRWQQFVKYFPPPGLRR